MRKSLLIFLLFFSFQTFSQSYNLQSGINNFTEDKYDEALDFFTKEIAQNPKESQAYFYNSLIYAAKDELAKALTQVNLAIQFNQTNDTLLCKYWQTKGNVYVKLKDTLKFENAYEKAIKLAPTNVDVYVHRATNYFQFELYDKALIDLKKVLEIDEVNSDALVLKARVYEKQKKYEEVIKQSDYLISLSVELPAAYILKSYANFYLDRFDEAINEAYNALLVDDKNTDMQDNFVIYSKKNFTLGLAKISRLIKDSPLNHSFLAIRSQIFAAKKDYKNAIKDYNTILELNTHSEISKYYSQRGQVYEEMGMHQMAIHDFTKSISFDTAGAAYDFGYRGDANRLMGNYSAAVKDFDQAIELNPEEPWFYYSRGWVKDEFLHDSMGGLADYNASIDLDKNYTYTYLHRGRLYAKKLNEPLKAKADFMKVIELDTAFESSDNIRHYAYFELGQNEKAKEWINKIIKANPEEGNYYDAACLYSLMKMNKQSLAYLDSSFQKGYRDFVHISKDDDLDNVRVLKEFKSLVTKWKERFNLEQNGIKSDLSSKNSSYTKPRTYKIPFKPNLGGTYEVASKINGLPLNMTFDTGSADISISQTEVDFMLKNGLLSDKDFNGERMYELANGALEMCKTLILKKVEFGGLILKNVQAGVAKNKNAGMLFGQSAMSRYGKITIDNKKKEIIIVTN
jgi:tetratricopeptide (TPR) repeat protein